MRHRDSWRPSKFVFKSGRLSAAHDTDELATSSRLAASLTADFYGRVIPAHTNGRVLDLACGKQPLYGLYAQRAEEVVAVDWPESLHVSPHLDLYCDVSRPLPFADDCFDTVISSDVLEHLPEPQLAILEIGRVLRPGGVLLLNTPFLYPVHEAPHDYHRHTRFSLTRLAAEAQLEVVELVPLGGVLDVLVDGVAKVIVNIPVVGPFVADVIQRCTAVLGNSMLAGVRRVSSGHFTLGHGMVARKKS